MDIQTANYIKNFEKSTNMFTKFEVTPSGQLFGTVKSTKQRYLMSYDDCVYLLEFLDTAIHYNHYIQGTMLLDTEKYARAEKRYLRYKRDLLSKMQQVGYIK